MRTESMDRRRVMIPGRNRAVDRVSVPRAGTELLPPGGVTADLADVDEIDADTHPHQPEVITHGYQGPPPDPSTAPEPPPLPRPGELIAGRYRTVRVLGAGGMGHVYLAQHEALRKQVALKFLAPRLAIAGPEQPDRFLREARAASELRHSGIVEITDFGTTASGLPFFAMEYLEGEDLAHRLIRDGWLPWTEAREVLIEILEALTVAHAHGIVHRDLKPDNCFVAHSEGAPPAIKLLDFGIAKRVADSGAALTREGKLLGTPLYMAPEQALGKRVDARADIYACGVILFELLTGTVPFPDGTVMQILSRHITEPAPSVRVVAPDLDLPVELEQVVAKALAKAPDDRFNSAREFAEALRSVRTQPQPLDRRARWPRRGAIAALGMTASLTLAAVGYGSWAEQPPAQVASARQVASALDTSVSVAAVVVDSSTTANSAPAAKEPLTRSPARAPLVDKDAVEWMGSAVQPRKPKKRSRRRSRRRTVAAVTAPRGVVTNRAQRKPPTPALTDQQVRRGLAKAAVPCRKWTGPGGQRLPVRVLVAANGKVASASVDAPYSKHPLGRCVVRVLNGARLAAAERGRSFAGRIEMPGADPDVD